MNCRFVDSGDELFCDYRVCLGKIAIVAERLSIFNFLFYCAGCVSARLSRQAGPVFVSVRFIMIPELLPFPCVKEFLGFVDRTVGPAKHIQQGKEDLCEIAHDVALI